MFKKLNKYCRKELPGGKIGKRQQKQGSTSLFSNARSKPMKIFCDKRAWLASTPLNQERTQWLDEEASKVISKRSGKAPHRI